MSLSLPVVAKSACVLLAEQIVISSQGLLLHKCSPFAISVFFSAITLQSQTNVFYGLSKSMVVFPVLHCNIRTETYAPTKSFHCSTGEQARAWLGLARGFNRNEIHYFAILLNCLHQVKWNSIEACTNKLGSTRLYSTRTQTSSFDFVLWEKSLNVYNFIVLCGAIHTYLQILYFGTGDNVLRCICGIHVENEGPF